VKKEGEDVAGFKIEGESGFIPEGEHRNGAEKKTTRKGGKVERLQTSGRMRLKKRSNVVWGGSNPGKIRGGSGPYGVGG